MIIESARNHAIAFGCPKRRQTLKVSVPGSAALALMMTIGPAAGNEEISLRYPDTRQTERVDERFGVTVADPFRWLENDPHQDPEVADWVAAQNALSARYLAQLPGRDVFHERLTAIFNHEVTLPPIKRGDLYFFTRNSGLDNQPQLFVREGVHGEDRTLIDPNEWAADGTMALAEWAPSADGSYLAFAMQDGGSDWRTIRVMDTATGEILEDIIEWARFTNIAWHPDGSGFYYARFPEPQAGAGFNAGIEGHAVYFHRVGTPQAEDGLVHAPASGQSFFHTVDVTPDGRYLIVYSSALTGGVALTVTDLSDEEASPRAIVKSHDDNWAVLGNVGSVLYLSTQMNAPQGRVVTIDLAKDQPYFVEVIPERSDAVLRLGAVLGDRIVLSYMIDAQTRVERYRRDGTFDGEVDLPGPGTTGPFHGRPDDDEAFFAFTSYDAPLTIQRLEVGANRTTVWAEPDLAVDLSEIVVESRH